MPSMAAAHAAVRGGGGKKNAYPQHSPLPSSLLSHWSGGKENTVVMKKTTFFRKKETWGTLGSRENELLDMFHDDESDDEGGGGNHEEVNPKYPGRGPLIPKMAGKSRHLKHAYLNVVIISGNSSRQVEAATVVVTRLNIYIQEDGSQLLDKIYLPDIQSVALHSVQGEEWCTLETFPQGQSSGRVYRMRGIQDGGEQGGNVAREWVEAVGDARERIINKQNSAFRRNKLRMRKFYNRKSFQRLITLLIVASFITVCIEAQEQPAPGSHLAGIISALDVIFTVVFVAEVGINFYAHYFVRFTRNFWNLFDVVIVLISIISLINVHSVNNPSLLFLSQGRAFRIFRLAGKFKQLKRIVQAIATSMVPMANGLLIALIFGSTCTVIGTSFFKETDPVHFGTFSRTFYTLWLAVAFGMWDTGLSFLDENEEINFGVVAYIVCFVIVMIWVSLQVVLAILLENFVSAQQNEQNRVANEGLQLANAERTRTGGLFVLLEALLEHYLSTDELILGISRVFLWADTFNRGAISFNDLKEGLLKLDTTTPILLSQSDWKVLTHDITLLNADNRMSLGSFHRLMNHQLRTHVQWHVAKVEEMNRESIESRWSFGAFRILFLDQKMEKNKKDGLGASTTGKRSSITGSRTPSSPNHPQLHSAHVSVDPLGPDPLAPLSSGEAPFPPIRSPIFPPSKNAKESSDEGSIGLGKEQSGSSAIKVLQLKMQTVWQQNLEARNEAKEQNAIVHSEMAAVREEVEDIRRDIQGVRGDLRNLTAYLRAVHDTPQSRSELGGATATLLPDGLPAPLTPPRPSIPKALPAIRTDIKPVRRNTWTEQPAMVASQQPINAVSGGSFKGLDRSIASSYAADLSSPSRGGSFKSGGGSFNLKGSLPAIPSIPSDSVDDGWYEDGARLVESGRSRTVAGQLELPPPRLDILSGNPTSFSPTSSAHNAAVSRRTSSLSGFLGLTQ
mmetsp:Transcript_29609/g.69192  ORF Transcript_29609/g.69192 Transcript_29609/m.69192 type:complete len:960 (-) Transcript_29609:170-3049(-)